MKIYVYFLTSRMSILKNSYCMIYLVQMKSGNGAIGYYPWSKLPYCVICSLWNILICTKYTPKRTSWHSSVK